MISCGARLAPFDIAELRELLAYDEMELDMIGDQKTALFIIVSDTDSTFNFVVALMYTQLLIYCATARMMCMAAVFRIMFVFCWTNLPILDRFPCSTN